MKKHAYYIFCLFALLHTSCKQNPPMDLSVSEDIRLNQLGFYPEKNKLAVIVSEPASDVYHLLEKGSEKVVYTGELSGPVISKISGKTSRFADFSDFNKSGEYYLVLPELGKSHTFKIQSDVFQELAKASIQSFYFQRVSTELPEKYAGQWARPAGHPDDQVKIHSSAVSKNRPENTIVTAPYGWYDAGDYNKYVVNSGITMGTLMALYEDFPGYFAAQNLNIPESENEVPDLLDEVLWNLKWMIQMQDPHDGGVYHKLTTARFEGTVMPHEATNQRYMVAKSTAATLDLAAVMAQAARVYKDFYPDMAAECLKAAENAWAWAKKNPDVFYRQNEINKVHEPEIHTGAYGDRSVEDEWIWAAAELYISTHNPEYLEAIPVPSEFQLPSWGNVGWLGFYSLLRFQDELKNLPRDLLSGIKGALLQKAGEYINSTASNGYQVVMGHDPKDFVWGSNSVASNQGIALIQAYRLGNEEKYLTSALSNLDYLLGRNATAYSYVTGYGTKTPQDPHHRPSGAEPDKPPVPGMLVGGPNPGQQDGCEYSSKIPDESYVDDYCSYASNEVAINWNAPFAYLVNALEAIRSEN